MHILIIPSWYPDERNINDVSGIFFKEFAEAFVQQGYKVSVLAHLIPVPLNPKKLKDFIFRKTHQTINSVQTYNVKYINWSGYRHIDESSSIEAAVRWFGQYIKKHGTPQIIHAHSIFNAGVIALKIKEKYNVLYYLTEHGSWFLKSITQNDLQSASNVLQNAAIYTAVSSVLLEKMIAEFHLKRSQGIVVPNILASRFLVVKSSTRSDKKFVFLHIALDSQNKRRDLLIESFALAYKGILDFELWIGGTLNENNAIFNLVTDLNIEKQIKILGLLNREQVHQAMANCDSFVLTSDIETFGIVLIEALSQGKPIISTDCGGPRDIVNERNGILVPTNNVKALANAMKKLKEEYNEYRAEVIREECLSKYHPNIVIKQYLSLFKS